MADAWNDSVDILSAMVALIAVGVTLLDPARFMAADHIGGFLVGLIVVFTGLRIAWETAMQLMDTMPDEREMAAIRSSAMRVPGVRGVEKCFARKTGLQYHVDLHLEVDPEMTVRESHDIAMRRARPHHAGPGLGGRRAGTRGALAVVPSPVRCIRWIEDTS